MPNHVSNILTIIGEHTDVKHVLESISGINEDGKLIPLDFNKVIPMPESLNIESGSTTDMCIEIFLTALNQRVSVFGLSDSGRQEYTNMIKTLNSSKIIKPYNGFLTECEVKEKTERILKLGYDSLTCLDDIYRLGMTALDNARKYGGKDWYDWSVENWGTKWNAYDIDAEDDYISFLTAWSAPIPIYLKLVEMFPEVDFELSWADEDMGSNTGCFRSEKGEISGGYHEDCSNEAYNTYVRCNGECECLEQDADGNWIRKNCDDCGACYDNGPATLPSTEPTNLLPENTCNSGEDGV